MTVETHTRKESLSKGTMVTCRFSTARNFTVELLLTLHFWKCVPVETKFTVDNTMVNTTLQLSVPVYYTCEFLMTEHRILPCNLQSAANKCFFFVAPSLWNKLPTSIQSTSSLSCFKKALKTHLFINNWTFCMCIFIYILLCVISFASSHLLWSWWNSGLYMPMYVKWWHHVDKHSQVWELVLTFESDSFWKWSHHRNTPYVWMTAGRYTVHIV